MKKSVYINLLSGIFLAIMILFLAQSVFSEYTFMNEVHLSNEWTFDKGVVGEGIRLDLSYQGDDPMLVEIVFDARSDYDILVNDELFLEIDARFNHLERVSIPANHMRISIITNDFDNLYSINESNYNEAFSRALMKWLPSFILLVYSIVYLMNRLIGFISGSNLGAKDTFLIWVAIYLLIMAVNMNLYDQLPELLVKWLILSHLNYGLLALKNCLLIGLIMFQVVRKHSNRVIVVGLLLGQVSMQILSLVYPTSLLFEISTWTNLALILGLMLWNWKKINRMCCVLLLCIFALFIIAQFDIFPHLAIRSAYFGIECAFVVSAFWGEFQKLKIISQSDFLEQELEGFQNNYIETIHQSNEKYLNDIERIRYNFKEMTHEIASSNDTSLEQIPSLERADIFEYSNSPLLNALIHHAKTKCREDTIVFSVTVKISESFHIADEDLGCLFLSLLNNTLETSTNMKTGVSVKLNIWQSGSYTHFKVDHNFENLCRGLSETEVYGTALIEEIVTKYRGISSFSSQDNRFTAHVALDTKIQYSRHNTLGKR